MALKTILLPVEKHDQIGSVFECAALFSTVFGSCIEAVPVRSLVADIYIAGAFGGVPVPQIPLSGTSVQDLRRIADAQATRLSLSAGPSGGATRFSWRDIEPLDDISLAARARAFDLTVFGRVRKDNGGPRMGALETTLFESGRPILIAPPRPIKTLGQRILIAWNGSTETARSIAFAMPLLERAQEVVVLSVDGAAVAGGPSGSDMAASLRVNGVAVRERTVPASARSTGEAFLAEAAAMNADLVIKGAYTQSRLRQMIFGGATNHILLSAELPVFMAH